MWNKVTDSLLAIDLAPEAVRVLSVALRRGTPTILSAASESVADGASDTLPERHLAALERLLSASRMRGRQCVAAVPTNLVTTRSVMVDPSKGHTPEDQIKQTLQSILTCDAKDLLFDFWKVGEANEKSRNYEVLVVAAQRAIIHKYLAGFTRLKLSCRNLDVAPCALASLIARLMPQQDTMVGAVALGDTMGYFAVVEKQRVLFWRPFELPTVRHGAAPVLERIGHEISKCVSHMVGTHHMDTMGEIMVFGNGVQDDTFANYIAQRFNLRVRAPSPFEALAPATPPAGLSAAAATHFAAALGLALRPAGGNHG